MFTIRVRVCKIKVKRRKRVGNYVQISSAILCFVLYTYVIIAAVYFGISFYAYRLANNHEYEETYNWVKRYLSPVLEIMNGFVLFIY